MVVGAGRGGQEGETASSRHTCRGTPSQPAGSKILTLLNTHFVPLMLNKIGWHFSALNNIWEKRNLKTDRSVHDSKLILR